MYAIKLKDGKIETCQRITKNYINKFRDDPSNPLNNGYLLTEDISGYEWILPAPSKPEKERILEVLGLTEAHLEKIKKL